MPGTAARSPAYARPVVNRSAAWIRRPRRTALALPALALFTLLGSACQSDAERARDRLDLARTHLSSGQAAAALDLLAEATRLDPALRDAWSVLADARLALEQWAGADAAAERAIALADTSAHDHETRAQAAMAQERWADAEPALERAITLLEGDRGASEAPLRTRLARVQEHLGREDDAIASYRRAIEVDARTVEARAGLARLHLGRIQERAERSDWDGDSELRTELGALLDEARAAAGEGPEAQALASLGADLQGLAGRWDALEEERRARAARADEDARLVRESALAAIQDSGLLGLFGAGSRGAFADALRDGAVLGGAGLDGLRGGDLAGALGESYGSGGLGARGGGWDRGGGGEGLGTIGLGSLGARGAGRGSAHEPGSAPERGATPRPTVQVRVTEGGSLDAAALARVAARMRPGLSVCYEAALRRSPGVSGTMTLEGDVTPAGAVQSPRVHGDLDGEAHTCMTSTIAHAAFPPSSARWQVRVAVRLTPGGAP
jgi:tetratricopeptide (TPR) repeat protein